MASDKQKIISSSIISLVLTIVGTSAYAMVSLGYKFWPDGFIYAGKSFGLFGLFSDDHPIKASYWFWGTLVLMTIIFIFTMANSEINKENASKRYKDREASRNTDVICAKCDQYLGTGLDYDTTCPRCGSNRYVLK